LETLNFREGGLLSLEGASRFFGSTMGFRQRCGKVTLKFFRLGLNTRPFSIGHGSNIAG
jgi:hypothetical protein